MCGSPREVCAFRTARIKNNRSIHAFSDNCSMDSVYSLPVYISVKKVVGASSLPKREEGCLRAVGGYPRIVVRAPSRDVRVGFAGKPRENVMQYQNVGANRGGSSWPCMHFSKKRRQAITASQAIKPCLNFS